MKRTLLFYWRFFFFIFSFCLSVFSINFWFFLVLVEGNLVTFCLFLRKMVDCQGRRLSWTMLKQGQTQIQNLDLYHLIFLLLLLHLRANQDYFASNFLSMGLVLKLVMWIWLLVLFVCFHLWVVIKFFTFWYMCVLVEVKWNIVRFTKSNS